ncbi:hypothetical protein S7711_08307 [Stachybotrys chartarum IBT 7711]|uniref:Uncharacterized protein n=1 Tax=Stachybotrys chartarum (strain CBS 109288 / IBT 7711) TaxID=1280523 RepID=A0A084AJI8_STACB|nr:hypothetical protein S7711_08307 [Stachybotrys chartarum IBT 7711]KFA75454.1 hypothetical protein S40288_01224 [Stachybotrys chartarum IBT 40288]
MAPQSAKANYKSYEAQARMVRAIVAAHPDVKWNYKEITACYGSDMTEHALNHRFRRLRAHCSIIREGRKEGLDMKDLLLDLPDKQEAVDKNNIAKYFGESTADGIQFQFRGIKKDVQRLKDVEKAGGDVARCLNLGAGTGTGTAVSTPTHIKAPRPSGSRSTGGKRKNTSPIKRSQSDDEDMDDDDIDSWSVRDEEEESPSKRAKNGALPGQKNGTPSRRAAVKAAATIADATAELQAGEDSSDELMTPTSFRAPKAPAVVKTQPTAAPSLFGNVPERQAYTNPAPDALRDQHIFNSRGADAYLGGDFINTSFSYDEGARYGESFDDGEI